MTKVVLSNSVNDSPGTLMEQLFNSRWLSGEFPYQANRTVQQVKRGIKMTLPGGQVLLQDWRNPSNIRLLQEARDKSWVLWASRDSYEAHFAVAAKSQELTVKLLNRITANIKRKIKPRPIDPNIIPVRFWFLTDGRPQSVHREIAVLPWTDIQDNYATPIHEPISSLMEMEPGSRKGKIILLTGQPGTGKTTLLRALGGAWRRWCDISFILDPENLLNDGMYLMTTLLDGSHTEYNRWHLVILEDSGELFSADAKQNQGQALSRLLNMSDGILGQGMNLLFALTTNEEVEGLHSAVIRAGRCLTHIEVPPLPEDEASKWLQQPVKGPQTLADLFALRDPETAGVIKG